MLLLAFERREPGLVFGGHARALYLGESHRLESRRLFARARFVNASLGLERLEPRGLGLARTAFGVASGRGLGVEPRLHRRFLDADPLRLEVHELSQREQYGRVVLRRHRASLLSS